MHQIDVLSRTFEDLVRVAERENITVDALVERWLGEKLADDLRRRMLEAAGANKPDPQIIHDVMCAVTMFDMHAQLHSDGRKRGLWIWLRDDSPDRMRQYQSIMKVDPSRVDGRVNEAALLEWPEAEAFHAAMGKAIKARR